MLEDGESPEGFGWKCSGYRTLKKLIAGKVISIKYKELSVM